MALLRHFTDSLFRIGNITAADNLLAADPEQFSKEARVGLQLQTANYTGASQLISTYSTATQPDVDFKFIQTLNLQRIVAGTKPSAVDSTALLAIALGYSPQSGYAKTLVGILYGRSFEPVLPPLPPGFQGESSEDRGVVSTASLTGFTLFPNPANDALTVNIIGTVEPETDEIMIFSVQGKLLLHQSVTSTTSVLDISQLQAGFYILSWIKTGHVQTSRYFVKTKI